MDIERERKALSVKANMLARRFTRCTVEVKSFSELTAHHTQITLSRLLKLVWSFMAVLRKKVSISVEYNTWQQPPKYNNGEVWVTHNKVSIIPDLS